MTTNTYDDLQPEISASTQYIVHESQPRQRLIKLDLVPARGLVFVNVNTRLREYGDDQSPWRNKP